MPVEEAEGAEVPPNEERASPPPKRRRGPVPAQKAPPPNDIQYVITFEQKYMPHPGGKLIKKKWPGAMFNFSRGATLEEFQAELLNRLSLHFDRKTDFTTDIIDCTVKIKSKVSTPQLLFPQTQYDFMISKEAIEVNLFILQKRAGRPKRLAPEDDINERPAQRRRLNAAADGADDREEGARGAEVAEGAGGRDEAEVEGDQPRRGQVGNRGLGQGFAANRGAGDDSSGDEGDLENEDPEDERDKEVARIMRQIGNRWQCVSRNCESDACWINADSEHVSLKIPHLRVWTEAIINKRTTINNPPNHLFFDPTGARNEVVRQEKRLRQPNQENQPIVIHNHVAANPPAAVAPQVNVDDIVLDKPRLPLEMFCARYGLSDAIQDTAVTLKISGAHGFHFVSPQVLAEKFAPGEAADIKYALRQWIAEG